MKALLLLFVSASWAACQDTPSWRAFPVKGVWCGAVMRAADRVQVYCYDDATNTTMGLNLLMRPLKFGQTLSISIPISRDPAQYEVDDAYNVPVGGVRWDFMLVTGGIKWTFRLPASQLTVYSGTFTQVQ